MGSHHLRRLTPPWLGRVLGLILTATIVALSASPARAQGALEFADWTAVSANVATGTLLGHTITLSGAHVSDPPGSTLDGTSPLFAGPYFTPPLPRSDAIEFRASNASASSYTLNLGAATTDPVLHLGSLGSTLQFPSGTSITRVSGRDDGFAVSGSTITGAANNTVDSFGENDSNGTVRLNGTFQSISFTASTLVRPRRHLPPGRRARATPAAATPTTAASATFSAARACREREPPSDPYRRAHRVRLALPLRPGDVARTRPEPGLRLRVVPAGTARLVGSQRRRLARAGPGRDVRHVHAPEPGHGPEVRVRGNHPLAGRWDAHGRQQCDGPGRPAGNRVVPQAVTVWELPDPWDRRFPGRPAGRQHPDVRLQPDHRDSPTRCCAAGAPRPTTTGRHARSRPPTPNRCSTLACRWISASRRPRWSTSTWTVCRLPTRRNHSTSRSQESSMAAP